MNNKQRTPQQNNRMGKGEPSVRIIAPTALNTAQLHAVLCRWWEDRKELWDDQVNGLGRGDSA